MWRPSASTRPPEFPGIGAPSGGRVDRSIAFGARSFAGFLLPSDPHSLFPNLQKPLSQQVWNALKIDLPKSVSSSDPWEHRGLSAPAGLPQNCDSVTCLLVPGFPAKGRKGRIFGPSKSGLENVRSLTSNFLI